MPGVIEMIGWGGMIVLLTAYFLRHSIGPITHALFNITASSMIAPICFVQETWPVFALQIAWGAIAVRDLVRAMRARHQTPAEPADEA